MYSESKPHAHDKHYSGLISIPLIIEKSPADGADVSAALVKQLLMLENCFNIEVHLVCCEFDLCVCLSFCLYKYFYILSR